MKEPYSSGLILIVNVLENPHQTLEIFKMASKMAADV